jgi:hypothetical protein
MCFNLLSSFLRLGLCASRFDTSLFTTPKMSIRLQSNASFDISNKLTTDLSIFFILKHSQLQLQASSNDEWIVYVDDRRAAEGYAIFVGHNHFLVIQKASNVSCSSIDSEYKALTVTVTEIS